MVIGYSNNRKIVLILSIVLIQVTIRILVIRNREGNDTPKMH